MDTTKSYIKVYDIPVDTAEDFEFDYDAHGVEEGSNDILTELVPQLESWGDIGWMEIQEYEYHSESRTMYFTLETKWAAPVSWLEQVSSNPYFQNKLITMTTIQKDETCVVGIAAMDGEILQSKNIFEMDSEEVGEYYNDDNDRYELDELDNKIWDSIGKFVNVCKQFYLGKEENNDQDNY